MAIIWSSYAMVAKSLGMSFQGGMAVDKLQRSGAKGYRLILVEKDLTL